MAPDGKDVVDVPPPNEGLHAGIVQKHSFKLSHKVVGIGEGHPCTHCCAVDLEVVLFPEKKAFLFKISEINSAKSAVGGDWVSLVLRASVHAAIPSS